ncbi:MAG: hypothetical protein M1609_02515 [Firmicutes bacterium]|nr:hypothetical protein [Bacillota bacterium]
MAMPEQNLVVAEINNYPESNYNRLFPCTLTQLSPLHKVMVNIVKIDPDSDSDVYEQKSNKGVSLTKISCLKLMTAANVIMEESKPILPSSCQRCVEVARITKAAPQCGSCQTKQDVAYQVSILVPEPSGGYRRYVATKEINKTNYKGLAEHMAAQCETKALLRALRAGLGIKGSYTKQELQKPFAVAVVVLNTTDPELKSALIQRFASGSAALFGGSQTALPSSNVLELPGGQSVDMATSEVVGGTVVCGDDDYPAEEYGPSPHSFEEAPSLGGLFSEQQLCDTCGNPLQQFDDPQTGHWSVERLAEYTKTNLGKVNCLQCATKALKQKRGHKA